MKIRFIILSLLLVILSLPPLNAAEDKFASARKKMVEGDLKGRDITDQNVLEIMGRVERHRFVDKHLQSIAYADHPLPIDEGQTISQPYIVALMTQILKLKSGEKVLEIGTGSGYQAAILSLLAKKVITIERIKELYEFAKSNLRSYKNVIIIHDDGSKGWEKEAPYDRIIVTASARDIPEPLIEQLKNNGKMVLPVKDEMFLVEKKSRKITKTFLGYYAFVPLVED